MLDLLAKYAVHEGLVTEPGYAPKTVRWALQFAGDGRFLGLVELGDTSQSRNPGVEFRKCPDLPPNVVAGGGEGRSHFLVESAQVVCRVLPRESSSPTDEDRKNRRKMVRSVRAKRSFFVELLRAASCDMPPLLPLAESLGKKNVAREIRSACITARVKHTEKVTLNIGGAYPVESDSWHRWWGEFRSSLQSQRSEGSQTRCFVSGEMREALAIQPKIRGLSDVGGIAMGDALICFDKEAFKSYGFDQAANCAVCEDSAAAYKAALDDLISKHSHRLAGTKVVHWFSHIVPLAENPLAWLTDGLSKEQQARGAEAVARDILNAIERGERPELTDNVYHVMTLSGAAGRVMVRDWEHGHFTELVDNAARWFSDLEITAASGTSMASSPGIERVVTSLLGLRKPKQEYKDWIKPIGSERVRLWYAALRGDPIAASVLGRLVLMQRSFVMSGDMLKAFARDTNREDAMKLRGLLYTRLALMKAYHIRKNGGDENLSPNLNRDHPSPAYQCGRLVAVLADVQKAALGEVGAGVVQRYYAAASSTPALVFGRLVRTSQFHLGKMKPRLAAWFDARIAEVWDRVHDSVPTTLTLEEQSLFALGYYHQIASDNAERAARRAKRLAQQASGSGNPDTEADELDELNDLDVDDQNSQEDTNA